MRTLTALVLFGLCLGAARAQDKKPEPAKPAKKETTLKVGDAPPPLTATKWLQGTEVKSFEKGKVYVVEFWATWCGPCIAIMPHMAELQAEYRDKGVTCIGFSAKDQRNTLQKVTEFVEKRGPKLGYSFAFADNRDTYAAWMQAAGQNGIPCCFVVGKDGAIAYIGHPMYLDEVLPKVVAGDWTAADVKALEKTVEETHRVFEAFDDKADPETSLKTLTAYLQAHPKLAGIPYFVGPHIGLLLRAKRPAEAQKYAEAAIATATKRDDVAMLSSISAALRGPDAKGNKELLALSLQAAQTRLKIAGESDPLALLTVAQAYFAAGDKEQARAYGEKAMAATAGESEPLKRYIKNEVDKFGLEK